MKLDPNARYRETHEWARKEGDLIVVGITDYAQESLSDVVYVELPAVGDTFKQGDIFGVVESVKAASDLYMPVSGKVVEINEKLSEQPELVNEDPFGEAWMLKVAPSDPAEWDSLLTPEAYEASIGEE